MFTICYYTYVIVGPELCPLGSYTEHTGEEFVWREEFGEADVVGELRKLSVYVGLVFSRVVSQGSQVITFRL